MARFSDIMRAGELQAAFTAYQAYLALPQDQKLTRYRQVAKPSTERVRPDRIAGYIQPFSFTGAAQANLFLEAKFPAGGSGTVGDNVITLVRNLVAARTTGAPGLSTDQTLPATSTAIRVPKFKFAKVGASDFVSQVADARSRFTNRQYTRVRTNTASANFGRSTGDPTFGAAVAAMRAVAAVNTFLQANRRNNVFFVPERGQ